jgi:hypothetical protein
MLMVDGTHGSCVSCPGPGQRQFDDDWYCENCIIAALIERVEKLSTAYISVSAEVLYE